MSEQKKFVEKQTKAYNNYRCFLNRQQIPSTDNQ